MIVKRFEPDIRVLKSRLRHWFNFDHLQAEHGIALLIGIEPEDIYVKALGNYNNNLATNEILSFGISLLNGDEISSGPFSDEFDDERDCLEAARKRFFGFVNYHRRLLKYWNSGKHPECTPPAYFVEWEQVAVEIELIHGNKLANNSTAPPDRAYVSNKLALLNQAAEKFWANADRGERSTHTDNATIVAWLIDRDYSATLAEKAATIIRPEWAPTGRKPEE
jgi:hypothetical protein